MARFKLPRDSVDVASRYWMPSLSVLVILFSAGWYTANQVGSQAGAAFITTLTVKGKVVRVQGKPVQVLVPPKTITKDGAVTTLPGRTIDLTVPGPGSTVTETRPTTVVITTTVPTTTTATGTTSTETVTVTETVTDTTGSTATVTTTLSGP